MENVESLVELFIHVQNGSDVTASVAIVGGREDGDHVPVMGPVVSLHHELMGPRHQVQPVAVVERL